MCGARHRRGAHPRWRGEHPGDRNRATASPVAHPRWRGEHERDVVVRGGSPGSSPLARGAPQQIIGRLSSHRLIPTGAGSTFCVVLIRCLVQAHPRWRGEHRLNTTTRTAYRGSSPLARGARTANSIRQQTLGLIPAGAGSTSPRCVLPRRAGAHPRWRGEHS